MKKLLLYLCCATMVAGCTKGLYGDDALHLSSIDDARNYFDNRAATLVLPNMLDGEKVGVRSGGIPRTTLAPNWDEATIYQIGAAKVMDVPLNLNGGFLLQCQEKQPDGTTKSYNVNRIDTRLTMIECDNAGLQMFITTMIPSWHGLLHWPTETRFMHPGNDFSGMMVLSDLDGHEIEASSLNIGYLLKQNGVGSRGRILDGTCRITNTGWCITHQVVHADEIVVGGNRVNPYPCKCGCPLGCPHCNGYCEAPPYRAPEPPNSTPSHPVDVGGSGTSSAQQPESTTQKPSPPKITSAQLDGARKNLVPKITNPKIKKAMMQNPPFKASDQVKNMDIGRHPVKDPKTGKISWIKASVIFFNEENAAKYNEDGLAVMIAHEYTHLLLDNDRLDQFPAYGSNHENVVNNPGWMQSLHDIFPNEKPEFYEKMKYAGCDDASSFLAKPAPEQDAILQLIHDTLDK